MQARNKAGLRRKIMNTEYLKNSYKWRLRTVAVLNVAVFWGVVVSRADFSAIGALLSSISIEDGIVGLIAPIATFVLDGLLSADAKARVVYWRCRHPLPGSRAFSEHLGKEARADPARLAQQWGAFPADPVEQNRLWYRIYKSVEQEIRVYEAHRAWLFSRDLAAYAVLFLAIFGIVTLISDAPWTIAGWYLVGLAVQCLAVMIAARTYGVRFVRTVLAIASQLEVEKGRQGD